MRTRSITPRSADIAAALERARRALGVTGVEGMTQSSTIDRLRASLARRAILILTAASTLVLLQLIGLVKISHTAFIGLAVWLILVGVAGAVARHERSLRALIRLHSAVHALDTAVSLIVAHILGAVFWMSPIMLVMGITFGAQTIPRRSAISLAVVASTGYVLTVYLESSGIFPSHGPFAPLTPTSPGVIIAAVVMVTMMLFQTATIQHSFNKQFNDIEERHGRLLDGTRDIIVALDPIGRILSINAAVTAQLGFERADVIDTSMKEFIFESDRAPFDEGLAKVFEGETIRMDFVVKSSAGRWRTLATTGAPIRDGAGRPVAALYIARDVTEQRTEGRRLAERELQLRLLVKSVNETVFTADREGRVTAVYGRWFSEGPLTIADVIGRTPIEVLGRRVGGDIFERMERALRGETVESEHELRLGEEKRSFRFWFTALRDEDNKVIGVTGVAYDITAQRRAERERDVLQASLEEARRTEAIGRLVAGIGHEINNPLAAILTFAEQLRAEARTPVDAAALEGIHAQAMRSRAIVRDLLAFVRPTSLAPITAVRAAPVLDDALRTLRPHTMSLGVELLAEPLDADIWITADVPGIEQVITNLVINAAHMTPAGGSIRVRSIVTDSTYSFAVEDTGPGISADAFAHLFEPFFTTKPVGQGTGLGLFVARGIIQRHGGSLRGENRPAREGGGARFTVDLPRTARPATQTSAGTTRAAGAMGPKRVLLIDDEQAIRTSLRRYFSRREWEVFEAGDGEEALEVLRAEKADTFALVLCDLRMPGMSGPQLHAHLREEFPSLLPRVVMVTGDVVSTESAAFVSATRSRVLEKPFELRVLGALADEMLASLESEGETLNARTA